MFTLATLLLLAYQEPLPVGQAHPGDKPAIVEKVKKPKDDQAPDPGQTCCCCCQTSQTTTASASTSTTNTDQGNSRRSGRRRGLFRNRN